MKPSSVTNFRYAMSFYDQYGFGNENGYRWRKYPGVSGTDWERTDNPRRFNRNMKEKCKKLLLSELKILHNNMRDIAKPLSSQNLFGQLSPLLLFHISTFGNYSSNFTLPFPSCRLAVYFTLSSAVYQIIRDYAAGIFDKREKGFVA